MTIIHALILAGGKSTRFLHGDKALYPIANKPMVQHLIEHLSPQVDTISISCNTQLEQYQQILQRCGINKASNAGIPLVFEDKLIQRAIGPLAGIYEFLRWLVPQLKTENNARKKHLVMLCSCDMPYIPSDIVIQLYSGMQLKNIAAAYSTYLSNKHYLLSLFDPIAGMNALSELPRITTSTEKKLFSVWRWLARMQAEEVAIESALPLINVNTAADANYAEQLYRKH